MLWSSHWCLPFAEQCLLFLLWNERLGFVTRRCKPSLCTRVRSVKSSPGLVSAGLLPCLHIGKLNISEGIGSSLCLHLLPYFIVKYGWRWYESSAFLSSPLFALLSRAEGEWTLLIWSCVSCDPEPFVSMGFHCRFFLTHCQFWSQWVFWLFSSCLWHWKASSQQQSETGKVHHMTPLHHR